MFYKYTQQNVAEGYFDLVLALQVSDVKDGLVALIKSLR